MSVLIVTGGGYAWVALQDEGSVLIGTPIPFQKVNEAIESDSQKRPVENLIAGDFIPFAQSLDNVAPTDKLRGRFVDSVGKGLAGIIVRLRTMRRADSGFFLRQVVTDVNGDFLIDELDSGAVYMLFTEALPGYSGYRRDGFTLSSLPAPFEIQLARLNLIDIEGTVVDTEHAPIANFTLTLESLESEYPPQTVTSNSSGHFLLKGFPVGELKIYTGTPDYFRILGLRTQSNAYRNLTLIVDRGPYRLTGRILDRRGLPVAAARITLNSTISNNEFRSHAYRTRRTDAQGNFEFADLGGIAHTFGVYANGYRPHLEYHLFQGFYDQVEIHLQ